ncbi:MAG: DUF4373 domain-containing protein [Bacteroidaceae bacterium]|nr:DUF4373 domain-containing protein [Bacteroidaceae bacterium]
MLYYFPHPTNLRIGKDVIRMRRQEGSAGYGIYVMLLELVRDSEDQQVFDDPESLAFAIHEDDVSMISRICHDYSLFTLTDDGYLQSPFLAMCQQQADERAAKAREWGLKGAKARYSHNSAKQSTPQTTPDPPEPVQQSSALHGNKPYTLPMGGGMPDPCLNQKEQPKGEEKESNQQPTKSKLVSLEWLGLPGSDWLEMCRSNPKLDLCTIEERFGMSLDRSHNPLMLRQWIADWPIPEQLYTTLRVLSDDWHVDHPVFVALNQVRVHAEKTQYRPQHPWEYLISTAIKFYNQASSI